MRELFTIESDQICATAYPFLDSGMVLLYLFPKLQFDEHRLCTLVFQFPLASHDVE